MRRRSTTAWSSLSRNSTKSPIPSGRPNSIARLLTFLQSCLPAAVSAYLLYFSFVPENGFWIAHAALVPVLVSLARGACRWFHAWLLGAVFAALYFWWLNVFSWMAPAMLTVLHGIWMALGLTPAIAAARKKKPWLALGLVVAGWTLAEHLRGLGPYGYEWGSLGYTQYGCLSIAGWVSAGGMALVSALVLGSNVLLAAAWIKKDFRWVAAATACWVVMAVASPQPSLPPDLGAASKFALLQTNLSPYVKNAARETEMQEQVSLLSGELRQSRAEVAVLPETLFSNAIVGVRDVVIEEARLLLAPLAAPGRHLVIGAIEEDTRGFYNAAVVVDDQFRRLGSYRKRHLVPLGETIPGLEQNSVARALGEKLGTPFFSAGDTPDAIAVADVRVAFLVCFEGTFARLVRESAANADVIVNLSNDAWTPSDFGHEQHGRFLRFRAIETGLPVLRVGNTGPTAAYAPNGELVMSLKGFDAGVLDLSR